MYIDTGVEPSYPAWVCCSIKSRTWFKSVGLLDNGFDECIEQDFSIPRLDTKRHDASSSEGEVIGEE
ncbi:hypothetical protein EBV26_18670 [bacterium]|nr:hypothetical protein [bacterium]